MKEEEKLRPIRKKEQAFLTRELEYWRQLNLLEDGQAYAISALYEPTKERFLQVLMGLGALLVGLGLLSYIAANWMALSRVFKIALIVGGYVLAIVAAYGFEPYYPHTSRAFLLIGSFAYGGGIFLIAQIFHEGGTIADALFWWIAGLVPACLLFKDRMQLLLIQVVALIFFYSLFRVGQWSFYSYGSSSLWIYLHSLPRPLAIIAGLWLLWRHTGRWSAGLHLNVFVTLNFIGIYALRCTGGEFLALLLLFLAIGLFLCIAPLRRLKDTLEGWGITLTGVSGLFLSTPYIWQWSRVMRFFGYFGLSEYVFAVAASILVCAVLLWHIYKGSFLATTFFCLMILRCYFAVFYDFMDKALFFTIGGVLLMVMGFYLQRIRKKSGQLKAARQVSGPWLDQ